MNNEATLQKMSIMRLWGMSNAFKNMLETGILKDMSASEALTHIIDSEYDARYSSKLKRLISMAGFRYSANINELSYSKSRKLDKDLILGLTDCNWIKKAENIIITGSTGVGKSYLSCAIGNLACINGYRVIYLNAMKLFQELKLFKNDGSYVKAIQKILKKDLVIIDDFGLHPMDSISSMILLEILEDRYERKSIIISSQYPTAAWFELIPDKTYADAICDRLIHKSVKIDLEGPSLRKKLIQDS